jgi:hypothetical protein
MNLKKEGNLDMEKSRCQNEGPHLNLAATKQTSVACIG